MEEVAAEMDIAFTTEFWTSPTHESFMMMSMHWITWDWSLKTRILGTMDVPFAKKPSTGTAQQRLFLVLKVVLHAVVVISEVLRLSTKSRCSRCCMAHL